MAEFDRAWISTVFTTDAQLQIWTSCTSQSCSHLNKLTYTVLVQTSEWILFVDLLVIVMRQECTSIITAESECHLSQVVCTEAEEFSFLSDFISQQSCTRNFNHCTNFIVQFNTCFSDYTISSFNNYVLNITQF